MAKLTPTIRTHIADPEVERVRRNLDERITQLQSLPSASSQIIQGVRLVDTILTPIAHKLGRRPLMISISPPQGATSTGRIVESQNTRFDPSKFIVLTATGHGATITVNIEVK